MACKINTYHVPSKKLLQWKLVSSESSSAAVCGRERQEKELPRAVSEEAPGSGGYVIIVAVTSSQKSESPHWTLDCAIHCRSITPQ